MSENDAAFRLLEDFRRRVVNLPDALIEEAGDGLAKDLEAVIHKTAGAGTTPDGKAWAPRKTDGGKAMPKITSALRVVYFDKQLIAALKFPYSLHHWGKASGAVRRQVLPDSVKVWQGTISAGLQKAFRKHFSR